MADPAVKRGIVVLERLLAALTEESSIPAETALLPNYPNPFNPEDVDTVSVECGSRGHVDNP